MDIKDFYIILGFFEQVERDTKLENPRERMDELFDFCSSVSPVEIEGYLYGIGETGLSRLENLKKAIWSSCKFISINHDRIWLCYESDTSFQESPSHKEYLESLAAFSLSQEEHISVDDLLGAAPDLTIVHEEDGADTTDIQDDDPDHEVLIAPHPEDNFSPAYRAAFTEYIVHEFLEGKKRVFLENLGSITEAAESSIEIIDRYISREKDRPKTTVEKICSRISPILSEFNLFTKSIDEFELRRMLSPENGKESGMQPSTMIKNGTLALHLLKLLEMDGPDYFRQNDWFMRIAHKWGVERLIHNRLYDFRQEEYSQKTYKKIKRLCDVVKDEMQIKSLKYEEVYLIR